MSKRVALYLRVSTNEQNTANQRLELEGWAKARGYAVTAVFEDKGLSGANGRDKRPAFDKLLKGAARRDFDVIAVWAIDRLGRSVQHLVTTLNELRATGVDLYIQKQALDTATPSGRAMFGMLSVFAEFEREMIVERIHSGLSRARGTGTRSGRAIGRPAIGDATRERIADLLTHRASVRAAAKATGASVGTVANVRRELVERGALAV